MLAEIGSRVSKSSRDKINQFNVSVPNDKETIQKSTDQFLYEWNIGLRWIRAILSQENTREIQKFIGNNEITTSQKVLKFQVILDHSHTNIKPIFKFNIGNNRFSSIKSHYYQTYMFLNYFNCCSLKDFWKTVKIFMTDVKLPQRNAK